jgi:peptide/nickel transport system substrate-binding protein
MKRLLLACLCAAMLCGFAGAAHAKTLKMALDADPVSLDPHVHSPAAAPVLHISIDPLVGVPRTAPSSPVACLGADRSADHPLHLREGVSSTAATPSRQGRGLDPGA